MKDFYLVVTWLEQQKAEQKQGLDNGKWDILP